MSEIDLFEYINEISKLNPGEILLNSVDHDGMMSGFDVNTIRKVTQITKIPIIASGGAGSKEDIYEVIKNTGVTAITASSIFFLLN